MTALSEDIPNRPDTFTEPVEPTAAVRAGVNAEVTP